MEGIMKKKIVTLIAVLVCVLTCVFALASCGKELNYLKADDGNGQLETQFDLGTFSADDLSAVKAKIAKFTFYYEYYPDKSTEKADMTKVKVKHFTGGGAEQAGLPQSLQANTSYSVYYYYEGHEPTADFSDSFAVRIDFQVN